MSKNHSPPRRSSEPIIRRARRLTVRASTACRRPKYRPTLARWRLLVRTASAACEADILPQCRMNPVISRISIAICAARPPKGFKNDLIPGRDWEMIMAETPRRAAVQRALTALVIMGSPIPESRFLIQLASTKAQLQKAQARVIEL